MGPSSSDLGLRLGLAPALGAATRKEGGRAWVPTPGTLSPAPLAHFHLNVQPRCPGLGLFTFLGTVVSGKKVLYSVKCSSLLFGGRVGPREVGFRTDGVSSLWEKRVAFTQPRTHAQRLMCTLPSTRRPLL